MNILDFFSLFKAGYDSIFVNKMTKGN